MGIRKEGNEILYIIVLKLHAKLEKKHFPNVFLLIRVDNWAPNDILAAFKK